MSAASTRLRVRVIPGAKQQAVAGRYGDGWKLRVTAPAEGGRANAAATALLAGTLEVEASRVAVVAGHGSRDKIVEVGGIDRAEAERRLNR